MTLEVLNSLYKKTFEEDCKLVPVAIKESRDKKCHYIGTDKVVANVVMDKYDKKNQYNTATITCRVPISTNKEFFTSLISVCTKYAIDTPIIIEDNYVIFFVGQIEIILPQINNVRISTNNSLKDNSEIMDKLLESLSRFTNVSLQIFKITDAHKIKIRTIITDKDNIILSIIMRNNIFNIETLIKKELIVSNISPWFIAYVPTTDMIKKYCEMFMIDSNSIINFKKYFNEYNEANWNMFSKNPEKYISSLEDELQDC